MKGYLHKNKEAYDKSVEFTKKHLKKYRKDYETTTKRIFKYLGKKENILELGPAHGYVTKLLSKKGHSVTALEFSKLRAKEAKKVSPKAKIINAEFLSHDFKNKKYPLVVAFAFIHLFPPRELSKVMKKIRSLLNKDGLLFINTTTHKKPKEGFLKRGDGHIRYRRQFTKKELSNLLLKKGFVVLETFRSKGAPGGIELINFICKKQS